MQVKGKVVLVLPRDLDLGVSIFGLLLNLDFPRGDGYLDLSMEISSFDL